MTKMLWICFQLISVCCICNALDGINPSVIRMSQLEDDSFQDVKENVSPNVTFSVAKHFQSNMVLQRAPKKARVYGFSPDIGGKVIAQMVLSSGKKYYYSTSVVQGPAPGVGSWAITLDPMNTTYPVSITFISQGGTLKLSNVLFGDVWVCSGQSNMEFTVSQMLNAAQEAVDGDKYQDIRLFTASERQSNTTLYDLDGIDENWTSPSSATLSQGAWKYFSAVCWLFGKHIYQERGYPIGLIATDWGGTPVEAWSSPDALKKCHVTEDEELPPKSMDWDKVWDKVCPQANSVLWNAMIYPFLGTSIYGAIWYQGEQDALFPVKMNRYNCTFPTMIDDWRSKFNQASQGQTSDEFPFGFVQLAAYRPNPDITVGFPDIRWHQTADVGYVPNSRMPNTFMAVAMDLPDYLSTYGSIHPQDKEDVGRRLALSGMSVAYGSMEVCQGPFPVKAELSPSKSLILDYGSSWRLNIKDRTGFEISCLPTPTSPLIWLPADILAHNSTALNLRNACKGLNLHAIRYAWRESPCTFKGCAVYSTINDLPAPPFLAYFTHSKDGNVSLKFK